MKIMEWMIGTLILCCIATAAWAISYSNTYVGWKATHINTGTSTAFSQAGGIIHELSVNTQVASETIQLYDVASANCNTHETSGLIAKLTTPSSITGVNGYQMNYDSIFKLGGCIETSSTADITVTSR